MAIAIYSHTLLVAPATEPIDPTLLAVGAPAYGTGKPVRGQLRATTPQAVYEAHQIEVKRPHRFLFDLGQESIFAPDYRATIGNRVFSVKTYPVRHDAGDACDYSVVILQEESLAE